MSLCAKLGGGRCLKVTFIQQNSGLEMFGLFTTETKLLESHKDILFLDKAHVSPA